jgi:type I restriction enzyme S subunit
MRSMEKNHWIPRKLNELGFVGRGKSKHRPRNDPILYNGPYPFIQTADIMASELYITKYSQRYSEKGLAQSKLWNENTLCMTIAGENTAETAILSFKACFPDSIVGFVADPNKADVRFVKYYLDTIKRQLKNVSKGATQDNLSLDKLLTFDILTPPPSTQRKIAAILSAYDDLVENNTRRIAILEEMAQSLYREWFVHFRFPGHEKKRLVESPLGMIPEGWEVKAFSEVAEFVNGFAFEPHHWGKSGTPIIKIAELKNGVTAKTPFYDGSDIPIKYHIHNGDVLFSWSADLDVYIWSGGQAFLNQHLFNVIPHQCSIKIFLFYSLKDHIWEFRNKSQGTTMKHIKRSALDEVKLAIPTPEQLSMFEDYSNPIILAILNLRGKNTNLRQTRNLLLPKLISGEVDVEELDISIEGEQNDNALSPLI